VDRLDDAARGLTMLRTAKPSDTYRIVDLLAEIHERSRYAGLPFDRRVARSLVMQAIQRNMGEHDGGCLVVVEEVDGNVEAFVIGTLSRVYMVVDALKATDLFLIAGPKATLLAARKLLGAYVAWAERNPAVYEIELTHTDVTPQSEGMGNIYSAMGFEPFGHAYRRANPAFAVKQREAA
jgi:hypothetical protein